MSEVDRLRGRLPKDITLSTYQTAYELQYLLRCFTCDTQIPLTSQSTDASIIDTAQSHAQIHKEGQSPRQSNQGNSA